MRWDNSTTRTLWPKVQTCRGLQVGSSLAARPAISPPIISRLSCFLTPTVRRPRCSFIRRRAFLEQLRGQTVPDSAAGVLPPVVARLLSSVLAQTDGRRPVWGRLSSTLEAAAPAPTELEASATLRSRLRPGRYVDLLPLLSFVKRYAEPDWSTPRSWLRHSLSTIRICMLCDTDSCPSADSQNRRGRTGTTSRSRQFRLTFGGRVGGWCVYSAIRMTFPLRS